MVYDVIIIGSGPSGLTAAIYTTRADLKTLVIAGQVWGGQLMLTSSVENFPGFPEGILGPELMMRMRDQAVKHGAEILDVNFKAADFASSPFKIYTEDGKEYDSKSVIIATGAQTKWLNVPGEKEKIGHGISSCATCDAAFYREKKVIIVGGGDAALEEALYLTKFTKQVFVVHRREELKASKVMQDRAFANKDIHFIFNTIVEEIAGAQKVEKVKLRTIPADQNIEKNISGILNGIIISKDYSGIEWEMPVDGIFVAIGHEPNSKPFKGIETDEKGFIKVVNYTKTNIKGVFVAGDVHDNNYKQAITAAGFGCMAALDAEKWLEENKK